MNMISEVMHCDEPFITKSAFELLQSIALNNSEFKTLLVVLHQLRRCRNLYSIGFTVQDIQEYFEVKDKPNFSTTSNNFIEKLQGYSKRPNAQILGAIKLKKARLATVKVFFSKNYVQQFRREQEKAIPLTSLSTLLKFNTRNSILLYIFIMLRNAKDLRAGKVQFKKTEIMKVLFGESGIKKYKRFAHLNARILKPFAKDFSNITSYEISKAYRRKVFGVEYINISYDKHRSVNRQNSKDNSELISDELFKELYSELRFYIETLQKRDIYINRISDFITQKPSRSGQVQTFTINDYL